jgi:hypothetical protein
LGQFYPLEYIRNITLSDEKMGIVPKILSSGWCRVFTSSKLVAACPQGNYLGQLNAGTNPQAAMKSTVRLKAPQFLRIDPFNY